MGTRNTPLAALLACLVATGCVDYALYTPCNTDADCEPDQFCFAGLCRDPAPCEQDEDCPPGNLCLEGNCLPPECVQNNDCPDDQTCVDFQCTPCNCITNEDCPPELVCQNECICVEPDIPPCRNDQDCPPWAMCVDGECVERPSCEQDGDCTDGQVCEAGLCVDGCGSDADCGALYICQAGHCLQQCFGDGTCIDQDQICENNLCVDPECAQDNDCEGEFVRCQAGRCEPYTACEADQDCPPNFVCQAGICEELPLCSIDANCPAGEICLDGHCHLADSCQTDADCSEGFDCVGGLCLPEVCRGPDDCDPGLVCSAGECVEPGNPARVYEVIILTPGGPIHQDQQVQLTAIALTQSGEQVAGVVFEWTSSQPSRAAVDAAGLLTGGEEAGQTQVRATASGTNRESRPVTFTNVLNAAADELRITVVEATGRAPVEGAIVWAVRGGVTEEATSDESGQVSFTADGQVLDLHVFAAGHDNVSILSSASTDLLVPMPLRTDISKIGGFTGQMTMDGDGLMSLGIAGISLGGDLLQLDFISLLGQIFNVSVELGQQSFSLPLPAQMVLGFAYADIPISIKDTYHVVGRSGLRTAWALGGRLDISVFGDLIGGGGGIGQILTSLFPYFALLNHGVKPVHDVHALPMVVDADDVDADGDAGELRPDWDNFLDVDLAPAQAQTMAVQIQPPSPPTHGGQAVSTALIVAGGLGELGFTPLGLSAAEADQGAWAPMTMKMAPAHGGLEVGDYAVLVMALPGLTGLFAPTDVAAVIHTSTTIPAEVEFETGFLSFPEDAQFHSPSRTLVASGVAGADLFRLQLTGPSGGWTVWAPALDLLNVTLPEPPAGMPDLSPSGRVTLSPIALAADLGFEDLVSFNGDDLDRLNRLVEAYSRYDLD